jgi:uncharacterized protein (TIGR03083 family)
VKTSDPSPTASARPASASGAGSVRSGKLVLRTLGGCDFDPLYVLDLIGQQREQFTTILRGFSPADWTAPTRCARWSAHDLVRHLCDDAAKLIATGPDDSTFDMAAGFDPRITPGDWLTASAGESPGATLDRYTAVTDELLAVLRALLAQDRGFDVGLPYGPMDWTVLMLHIFWDSWIHERDVLLPHGRLHPAGGDAIAYATAYGIFMAAAVATMVGETVQETLALSGDGGGTFTLYNQAGVTVAFSRENATGPLAAGLADALAGRSQTTAALDDLPARSRSALSQLSVFLNTPTEPPSGS